MPAAYAPLYAASSGLPNYSLSPNVPMVPGPGIYNLSTHGYSLGPMVTEPGATVDTGVTPVVGTDGKYYNPATGKTWSGTLPDGGRVIQGQLQPNTSPGNPGAINPNNPMAVYQGVSIPKNPDIAAGEQNLMQQFTSSANSALDNFDKYLSQFTTQLGGALGNINKAIGTADTTAGALTAGQQQYAQQLAAAQSGVATTNAANASAEQGLVGQAEAVLPKYQQAQQAIADQELQALQADISKYKLGTGTPSSMGSDEQRILAQGVQNIQLPLTEAQLAAQENIIQNLALPVQEDITNRLTQQYGSIDPALAAAGYSSNAQTAQAIQSLRQNIAGMSLQDATAYLQAAAIPAALQQQILQGSIGTLGGLGQLESASNYQGLQNMLGQNLSTPVGFNNATPPNPRAPSQPANAPINVGPGQTQQTQTGTGAFQPNWTTQGGVTFLPTVPGASPTNPIASTGPWQGPVLGNYPTTSTGTTATPVGGFTTTPDGLIINPATGIIMGVAGSYTGANPLGQTINQLVGDNAGELSPSAALAQYLNQLNATAAAGGTYSTAGGDYGGEATGGP